MADEKKEEKTLEEAFSELDVLAGRLEDRGDLPGRFISPL